MVHQQGGVHQDDAKDEGDDQEDWEVPDLKPSLRMTVSHPEGNQGPKGRKPSQTEHGQGDHPANGGGQDVHDQDDQKEEEEDHRKDVQEEVQGSPTPLQRTPPSTSSRRTPPNSRKTPEARRVVCTPLWKRKSLQRMSSSSTGKKQKPRKKATLTPKCMSQSSSPTSASPDPIIAYTTTTPSNQMSTSTERTCPGSQMPRNNIIIAKTLYAQKKKARTSAEPTEVVTKPDQLNGKGLAPANE